MAAHTNEATICTVSTPFHKRLLYYNYELTKALNPGHETRWVIVNNTEIHISRQRIRQLLNEQGIGHNEKTYRRMLYKEQRRYHDSTKMHEYIPEERILGGLSLADVMANLPATSPVEGETQEQFDYRKDKVLQSYHHAYNLELALSKVATRFAIIIDPEHYVVRPDWLLELITQMKMEQLAVFGAPWNPRYFQKFRYFPATHFMIVDLEKVPKAEIKLLPDLLSLQPSFEQAFWRKYCDLEKGPAFIPRFYLAMNAQRAMFEDLRQRSLIGKSRDSGYLLYEACAHRPDLKVETVSPVYKSSDGFVPPTVSFYQRRMDERAFRGEDDRVTYLPRRAGFIVHEGFVERGYPDFRDLGWEESFWKDEPFAFHIRGEVHRARVGNVEEAPLVDRLNAVLARHGARRLAMWAPQSVPTPEPVG